jgi:hypothetical protein
MGVMRQVLRTFEVFDNPDREIAQFVEWRVFPECDQVLVLWSHSVEPRLI